MLEKTSNVVMGWDAAWTPSGSGAWCILSQDSGRWNVNVLETTPQESRATLKRLDDMLSTFCPDAVAIDMPVADHPITGYREADRATTRAFSRYGCPVHSPTPARPGSWGWECVKRLHHHSYHCGTRPDSHQFYEVYPHTVCLSILRRSRRFPYKIQRSASYWPDAGVEERRSRTLENLRLLLRALKTQVDLPDVEPELQACRTIADIKRIEDKVDALLCGWAGIQILAGAFIPYGNEVAAIWNPCVKGLDAGNDPS